MKLKVLFLCASNGLQSPIAEVMLARLDSEHFEVTSAGVETGETHPLTIEVMKEIGFDLEGRRTKSVREVADCRFDFVITLCDRAKLECPNFPDAERIHWQFDDPLAIAGTAKQYRMFCALRDQIAQRIRLFALVQARSTPINAGEPRPVLAAT